MQQRMPLSIAFFLFVFCCVSWAQAPPSAEQRAARQFNTIRDKPPQLLAFLRQMPKGGDLHVHLSGALYAENMLDYAIQDGLCVDRSTSKLVSPPCDTSCDPKASKPAASCAYADPVLFNSLIDAWSMRNWRVEREPGHDHFFATFDKFGLATRNHTADALAEVASRAADNHLQYVEIMNTGDGGRAAKAGAAVGWDEDFPKLRDKLLENGLREAITATLQTLDTEENKLRQGLKCGTAEALPGCTVTLRYLYQVLRGLPKEQVFAQILTGFELASSDPRFVGLNLVQPEDSYVPMRDFKLHMKILDYLHGMYPKVHITLHAGELAEGLVPPEGLRFHVRYSVEQGHAERIGHGVAVMHEDDATGLLKEMASKNVLVEICLTSNDVILGVSGKDHPLPTYLQYGVPVTLATDDLGVSRGDITQEYLRATETYGLSYFQLKRMARQSLEHSFLPGASLWAAPTLLKRTAACSSDRPGKVFPVCREFLSKNERAQAQWKLEEAFAAFESSF